MCRFALTINLAMFKALFRQPQTYISGHENFDAGFARCFTKQYPTHTKHFTNSNLDYTPQHFSIIYPFFFFFSLGCYNCLDDQLQTQLCTCFNVITKNSICVQTFTCLIKLYTLLFRLSFICILYFSIIDSHMISIAMLDQLNSLQRERFY